MSDSYQLTGDYQEGTPCEVTGIVEEVAKKTKVGNKWSSLSFVVLAPKSRIRFDCTYSGFGMLSPEDRIYVTGFKTPTRNSKRFNMIVNSNPIIEPGATKSSVLSVFTQAFPRWSKLTAIRAEDIFNEIERSTRDLEGDEVDRVIMHMTSESNKVANGKYDIENSLLFTVIDNDAILGLYKFWYKNREKRKLQMLGLRPEEIDELPWTTDVSYEKLRNNPYTVPFLSLDRCRDMLKSIKKVPTSEQIRRGEILREIYQSCKERSWAYYPYRYLAENFPDYNEHMKTLTAETDPEGNTKYGYGLISDDENQGLYLTNNYIIEEGMSQMLAKRVNDHKKTSESQYIVEPFYKMDSLTDDQKKAIYGVLNNSICVITGGAGCGKTTCIMEIVNNYISHNIDFVICSFTGKAVTRVKEVLGQNQFSDDIIDLSTCTLHRGIHKGLEKEKVTNLIIDETSMVTTELLYKFLSIFTDIRWITMVGDYNQLLPISWGSLFKEVIFSERFPVFRLYVNHRTYKVDGQRDGITYNAESMIASKDFEFEEYNNFRIISGNEKTVESLVRKMVETENVKDNEIVVLTPRNQEQKALNITVSNIFRPKAQSIRDSKDNIWKIGDLVIATENIYGNVNVMNGTAGRIIEFFIGTNKNVRIRVSFDKYTVENWDPKEHISKYKKKSHYFDTVIPKKNPYGGTEKEKTDDSRILHVGMLTRSGSLTVHKSQGSEWKYIIFYLPPDIKASKGFLNKNLMYTGITRGKAMVILVCNIQTANLAANTKPAYRAESLSKRIAAKLDIVYKRPSMYEEDGEDVEFDDDPYEEDIEYEEHEEEFEEYD